ncbi:GIY-YIG nuclease family protein [Sphingomonas cannabina]|uniref:GIY-YIG nuclease family protein n=1 Tax=Sphingomonas cannabina TaxID=2899123 RepID=UPI001F2B7B45|nr:GIY-YIG nuclease family protein [Sphingomonas cannabina]UIJ45945.1 GIY-YIG nuclease family protein [Sphingomonas cannabina]
MEKRGFVYIVASQRNGTIYIGSTSNLPQRIWQHRNGVADGFTKEHRCHILVWYEAYDSLEEARLREKRMKEWKRSWKLREIEGPNPDWEDLYPSIANG